MTGEPTVKGVRLEISEAAAELTRSTWIGGNMPWNMDAMSFSCGFGGCPGCCWKLFRTSCTYGLATDLAASCTTHKWRRSVFSAGCLAEITHRRVDQVPKTRHNVRVPYAPQSRFQELTS